MPIKDGLRWDQKAGILFALEEPVHTDDGISSWLVIPFKVGGTAI